MVRDRKISHLRQLISHEAPQHAINIFLSATHLSREKCTKSRKCNYKGNLSTDGGEFDVNEPSRDP